MHAFDVVLPVLGLIQLKFEELYLLLQDGLGLFKLRLLSPHLCSKNVKFEFKLEI